MPINEDALNECHSKFATTDLRERHITEIIKTYLSALPVVSDEELYDAMRSALFRYWSDNPLQIEERMMLTEREFQVILSTLKQRGHPHAVPADGGM